MYLMKMTLPVKRHVNTTMRAGQLLLPGNLDGLPPKFAENVTQIVGNTFKIDVIACT